MGFFGPVECGMCGSPLKRTTTTIRTGDGQKLTVCANCAREVTKRQSKAAIDHFYETGEVASKPRRKSSVGCLALIPVLLLCGCLVTVLNRCNRPVSHPAASLPNRPSRAPTSQTAEPAPPSPSSTAEVIARDEDVVTEVSAERPAIIRDGTVSKRIYREITVGMNYTQVTRLIGGEGKSGERSRGSGGERVIYSWPGRGEAGASFTGVFDDGILVSKAEFNLR